MESKLKNDMMKLKDRIEGLRKELNSLTVGVEKCYKDEKILKISTALDQIILEYMKNLYSVEKND